nr:MAG: hypothetical protein [Caudoviricetes sp.]
MEKTKGKVYQSSIQEGYDQIDGQFYFVELPKELLDELGWEIEDELDAEIKLGEKNNVIVIKKK